MDLELSPEQLMLGNAVRAVCERHATIESVRRLEGDRRGFDDALWDALRAVGVVDLLVEGPHHVEVAVVAEELGRFLAPSPFVETAVFGATLLGRSDELVVPAWHEPGRSLRAVATRFEDGRLWGEKILVPFAAAASSLLTVAREGDEVVVAAVDPRLADLEFEATLASDARYRVSFEGAPAAVCARGWTALDGALQPALVAVAAYAVGGAERAHELAVEYAKERIQFDRPIGSFQAIAHPLADLATEIAGARALVYQAAWAMSTGRRSPALSAMAKSTACDVFRRTAKFAHQVFGGIGFTLAVDVQLFLRRAKQLELLWMGPRDLDEVVAAAELDAEEPLVTPDAVASGVAVPPTR